MEYKKINEVAMINKISISSKMKLKFINYLDTGNITNGRISEIQLLENKNYPSRAKRLVKYNDIVYSTVRPNQCHYGILKNIMPNMVVSTGFAVLSPNEEVNADYLYYYLILPDIVQKLQNIAETSTSTYPSIKPADIGNLLIPLPELDIQKKIGCILSNISDKIEFNNKINENFQSISQLLFKHWFVDFEFPDQEGLPYKSSGGEMVESELGMIPKGWEAKSLDYLCNITSSKRIFMNEYVQEGVPFYRGKEIIEKSKGSIISTELFISSEKYNKIKEKFSVPRKGDILLTSVGTLGVPYKVENEKFYFKDGNITWFKDFIAREYSNYIYLWLLSKKGKEGLNSITIGSTQKALTIASLMKLKLVIPNDSLLNKFESIVSKVMDKIYLNNLENKILIDLRDALLPKLMNGEIDLSNIEINQ